MSINPLINNAFLLVCFIERNRSEVSLFFLMHNCREIDSVHCCVLERKAISFPELRVLIKPCRESLKVATLLQLGVDL